jgi:hypothetical protein
MKITITRCDIIATLFLLLLTAMEVTALFLMAAPEHRCVLRLIHVSVLTFAFNVSIAWFAIKYKAIKDKYHPNG